MRRWYDVALLLLTLYSNKLDLFFYINHKLMDYLHHSKIIKTKYIHAHIKIQKTENDEKYMDKQTKLNKIE